MDMSPTSPCLTMAMTPKSAMLALLRPTLSISSCFTMACFSRNFASSSMMDWRGPSTSSKAPRSTVRHLHLPTAATVAARGASWSSARSPKYWYWCKRMSSCGSSSLEARSSLRVHTTSPSTMIKKVKPMSPCLMMSSPSLKVTSLMISWRRWSWVVLRLFKMSTERSTLVSVDAEDFMSTRLNEERAMAQRTPSVSAVTVAARGFEYMSASSPKKPVPLYSCTGLPSLMTRKLPDSMT
mmetsp:Transcript_26324/g.71100  ORF Transcript_26324/g.71100 Transcript_26324/m.71100 type:complete len:239 (-) Transcript_26324:440-1156(-)